MRSWSGWNTWPTCQQPRLSDWQPPQQARAAWPTACTARWEHGPCFGRCMLVDADQGVSSQASSTSAPCPWAGGRWCWWGSGPPRPGARTARATRCACPPCWAGTRAPAAAPAPSHAESVQLCSCSALHFFRTHDGQADTGRVGQAFGHQQLPLQCSKPSQLQTALARRSMPSGCLMVRQTQPTSLIQEI